MRTFRFTLPGLLALCVIACDEREAMSEDKTKDEKVITTDSGLKYVEREVGKGKEAEKGDVVSVHYVGTLESNGKEFDNSRKRGEPIKFPLGAGRVIKGWDEGISGMKVGGKRKLIIPPKLGYGDREVGPIPAGSTLVFEVELVGVEKS